MIKSKTASEMWNIIESLQIKKIGKLIINLLESDSFIPCRKGFLNAFKCFCSCGQVLMFHLCHTKSNGTEFEALPVI